jgi:hypothetical protein
MHCRKDSERVACFVGNYAAAGGANFDRDPASADVAGAATSGTGFATVAMEYATIEGFDSAGRVVKFFTYAPNRVTEAALDQVSFGRNQPQVCMICHGGRIPFTFPSSVADVEALSATDFTAFITAFQNERSSFREFDLGALRNLQGSNPENNVRQLNCDYVLDADPWDEVQNLILGWYGGTNDCDGVGSPVQNNYNPWTSDVDVYDQVVANSCRTCHVAQQNIDFSDPNVAWNGYMGGGSPFTCSLEMPQAAVTYNSYHIEGQHDFMQTRYGPCPP